MAVAEMAEILSADGFKTSREQFGKRVNPLAMRLHAGGNVVFLNNAIEGGGRHPLARCAYAWAAYTLVDACRHSTFNLPGPILVAIDFFGFRITIHRIMIIEI